MKHIALWPTLVLVLLAAAVSGAINSSPALAAAPTDAEPVFVESTDILLLESFPVQVVLRVTGKLPTPCHTPAWAVNDLGDTIEVDLWSTSDPEALCVTVLEPFDVPISLGSYESADIYVVLNGESVGRIEIGTPPDVGSLSLVGAGWSFGMCGGYCMADLEIAGRDLVLTGGSYTVEEPLYVNHGTLTSAGEERIDAALQLVAGETLEPIYGCPDCADGGSTYLTLEGTGGTTQHTMEFSTPPTVLADLHAISMAMISNLETCTSSDLVTISDDCEPVALR
jgi:hypothetical protein